MKRHLIGTALFLLFLSQISAAEETAEAATATDGGQYDSLRFADRDMISGKLISLQPDKFLIWSHPDTEKNIEFKYANLREISLSGKHPNPPAGTANIGLTNGDIIKGSILSLDSQNLIVKTWYAGELKIDRKTLREIVP